MSWFSDLMGFAECGHQTQEQISLDGNRMHSLANGASWVWGSLEIPTLQSLRVCAKPLLKQRKTPSTLRETIGDVQDFHGRKENGVTRNCLWG